MGFAEVPIAVRRVLLLRCQEKLLQKLGRPLLLRDPPNSGILHLTARSRQVHLKALDAGLGFGLVGLEGVGVPACRLGQESSLQMRSQVREGSA